MQGRTDGKVYPDLHKTDLKIYLLYEDALEAFDKIDERIKPSLKILKLIAVLPDEYVFSLDKNQSSN